MRVKGLKKEKVIVVRNINKSGINSFFSNLIFLLFNIMNKKKIIAMSVMGIEKNNPLAGINALLTIIWEFWRISFVLVNIYPNFILIGRNNKENNIEYKVGFGSVILIINVWFFYKNFWEKTF